MKTTSNWGDYPPPQKALVPPRSPPLMIEVETNENNGRPVVSWFCGELGGHCDCVEDAISNAEKLCGLKFPRKSPKS